ncbi:methyltransferase domain-containing protein [bacterium]|nr:methyltransferase domain-containing protein [bacterium]
MTADDRLFSRTEYRRVIAWPERILREAPFLAEMTSAAPERSLLDVGCGTGEHARHFAEQGWRAVGIDLSEKMIGDAQDHAGETEAGGAARFELRDAADAGDLPDAPFGAAICLGNAFAFLEDKETLDRFLSGVAAALLPGAPFLVQLLNYERIVDGGVRTLGVNVRPLPDDEGDGEIVFLRVFRPREDGSLGFFPITLTLTPGEDPPVRVRSSREGTHHPWRRSALEAAFARNGFADVRVLGGMGEVPYDPMQSPDLVLHALRR